ncbi:MAG TPA: hypothetical protein VGK01_21570 [Candidatus Angelobacter sp.]|jgi:hypothetical protein
MATSTALDRDALYYPYIHITDINWLKSTLLCFPNVRRMVPTSYTPDDSKEIREFCEVTGPRGTPLLTSVNLFSPGASRAELNLLARLQANDRFIRSRYSRLKTLQQYPNPADHFLLHDEKIISQLSNYLVGSEGKDALAWRTAAPPDRPTRSEVGQWLALHPTLGSAILSVKAISIADEFGLDIVTDSSFVHHSVVSTQEDDIFEDLIGKPAIKRKPTADETVDDLTEIVMATNFDASKLSAKQIAELLSDGKDLKRFKDELVPLAASIPAISDPKEREQRLKAAADEVVEKWKKYRKSLPRFALDALVDTTEVKWPDVTNSLILAGSSALTIGSGVGLSIFLVSYAGLKIWRKYKEASLSPYAYLNRIGKAQGKSQSFLSLPPLS